MRCIATIAVAAMAMVTTATAPAPVMSTAPVQSPPAEDPMLTLLKQRVTIPIVTIAAVNGGALALHADASWTFAALATDGSLVLSISDAFDGEDLEQPEGVGPVQWLVTRWTDAKGLEHEVRTPVPSQTKAAHTRAEAAHEAEVARMLKKYPVAPAK